LHSTLYRWTSRLDHFRYPACPGYQPRNFVRSAQLLFLLTQDRWFALRRARSQLQVQRRLREISSSTSPLIFWIELIKTGASRYFARIDNILTRKFFLR
jgi:hypothetical protein